MVTVKTGVNESTDFSEVGSETQRAEIVWNQSLFLKSQLSNDCRALFSFLERAEAHGWPVYGSRERYIEDGLGLPVQSVDWAEKGLNIIGQNKPVSFEKAKAQAQSGMTGTDRKEREAGKLYHEALENVRANSQRDWMLAQHIKLMIEGTVDNPGPLWRSREVPPEGRYIELDSFEDYLLRDPRDGLGIPSLLHVHYHLRGEDKGEEALALLRREIRDYDTRIQREEAKRETKRAKQQPQPTHEDNPGGRGRKSVGDTNGSNRNEGSGYYLRRLARDRPDLLSRVESGELTANAAAIEAGYRKQRTYLDKLKSDWRNATEDERAQFEEFINDWRKRGAQQRSA